MIALVLAAIGAAQITVASFMEPPPPKFERNNVVAWSALPTLDQLYAAYPPKQHGRATVKIDCEVGKVGELKNCDVYYQRPDRGGAFGRAALTLAPYFRVRPDYAEQILLAGSKVSVEMELVERGDEGPPQRVARCAPPGCAEAPAPPPPLARCPPTCPAGPQALPSGSRPR